MVAAIAILIVAIMIVPVDTRALQQILQPVKVI